ncbi:DUF7091 family protein [Natronocalculus amylovorans]|uniref:Uncharacterized protein n=1 Tax=Natronocalculus amylovorans TaxID=2917812 RepID=A0AAE3K7U8_9EURY|nr:hypothetical protein [Natronocalculus amylovorans]MCL9815830.1 hypothetical protein [Natronocalculus amylovorans]
MSDRIGEFLRERLRQAGRSYEEAKHAYRDGKATGESQPGPADSLPADERGRSKIVCRRHAERRAVPIDTDGKPACYDSEHPDCRGCVEDIKNGSIEVW